MSPLFLLGPTLIIQGQDDGSPGPVWSSQGQGSGSPSTKVSTAYPDVLLAQDCGFSGSFVKTTNSTLVNEYIISRYGRSSTTSTKVCDLSYVKGD